MRSQGFEPVAIATYKPRQALRVLIGRPKASSTGVRGRRAFFFVREQYIGTDAATPSLRLKVASQSGGQITLAYTRYAAGDKPCCPSDGTVKVRFAMGDGRLAPLDPIPPDGQPPAACLTNLRRAMCGRYTLTQVGPTLVDERFQLGEVALEPATLGRFNVCPTEDILVVTHKGPRAVRWGLVPSWSKEMGKGPLLINARSETVASKKVFSRLLERPERRCLVIADGWYEWLRPEKKGEPRVPFHYRVDGGELFAFAGLCDVAKIDGEWVPSATILTTTANAVCAPVHDRMPVVLGGPDEEAAWMQGGDLELLGPLAAERTSAAPANPAVNKAGVEGAELLVVNSA